MVHKGFREKQVLPARKALREQQQVYPDQPVLQEQPVQLVLQAPRDQ
jgi:hypothetical protein